VIGAAMPACFLRAVNNWTKRLQDAARRPIEPSQSGAVAPFRAADPSPSQKRPRQRKFSATYDQVRRAPPDKLCIPQSRRAILARLGSLNLAVEDLDAMATFYAALFGFAELTHHRNEHFRVLDANGVLLGFNDAVTSQDYGGPASGGMILSFDVPARADIDKMSEHALKLGAVLKKPIHETSFGAVEAMFADPEGRAFRILAWTQPPQ